MITVCVVCGISIGLSVWAAWGTKQNTESIENLLKSVDNLIDVLKHEGRIERLDGQEAQALEEKSQKEL